MAIAPPPMTFCDFFKNAVDVCPFDYQSRLAESPLASLAIRVPTGAGKTAAATGRHRRFSCVAVRRERASSPGPCGTAL